MILLTGYKGFIGSHLQQRLLKDDIVLALDAKDDNLFEMLEMMPWSHITEIYHQGAISDTTETDVDKIYRHNVQFSLQLFEHAIKHGIPVKYASSASIYGNSNQNEYNPLNYYALSKLTVDLWVMDNIHRFKSIVGFRYFNVYGENENKTDWTMSPVSQFTKQAKETGVIKVFKGSENMKRDFICVDDVVNIVTKDHLSGVYDLGTGKTISFLEIAELVAEKYNAKIEVIPFPDKLKNKYQFYTRSSHFYDYGFISVKDFLDRQ